jgi:hypothetical protein
MARRELPESASRRHAVPRECDFQIEAVVELGQADAARFEGAQSTFDPVQAWAARAREVFGGEAIPSEGEGCGGARRCVGIPLLDHRAATAVTVVSRHRRTTPKGDHLADGNRGILAAARDSTVEFLEASERAVAAAYSGRAGMFNTLLKLLFCGQHLVRSTRVARGYPDDGAGNRADCDGQA